MRYDVLGLSLCEAQELLKREGKPTNVVYTRSYKPYENADSIRVLRTREKDGICELVVGEFISNVKTSQG